MTSTASILERGRGLDLIAWHTIITASLLHPMRTMMHGVTTVLAPTLLGGGMEIAILHFSLVPRCVLQGILDCTGVAHTTPMLK